MSRFSVGCLFLVGILITTSSGHAQDDLAARGFKFEPTTSVLASAEDVAAGEALYLKACDQCHGPKGDGQGVMADLLFPRPRDFLRGLYKVRSTPSGELPTDQDLFKVISLGMPGTSMPAWQGVLTDEQIWQLVHYVKTFTADDFTEFPAKKAARKFRRRSGLDLEANRR